MTLFITIITYIIRIMVIKYNDHVFVYCTYLWRQGIIAKLSLFLKILGRAVLNFKSLPEFSEINFKSKLNCSIVLNKKLCVLKIFF